MSKYGDFKNNFLILFYFIVGFFSHYEEIVIEIAII